MDAEFVCRCRFDKCRYTVIAFQQSLGKRRRPEHSKTPLRRGSGELWSWGIPNTSETFRSSAQASELESVMQYVHGKEVQNPLNVHPAAHRMSEDPCFALVG